MIQRELHLFAVYNVVSFDLANLSPQSGWWVHLSPPKVPFWFLPPDLPCCWPPLSCFLSPQMSMRCVEFGVHGIIQYTPLVWPLLLPLLLTHVSACDWSPLRYMQKPQSVLSVHLSMDSWVVSRFCLHEKSCYEPLHTRVCVDKCFRLSWVNKYLRGKSLGHMVGSYLTF